jgi:hypothetical protein
MSHTVFADGMAMCHSNSPGKAIGFPDTCLSPPPPPAGPVPVPYPNTAMASDLSNGSTSVTADGGAIALEDASYIATSTGDEAGTQGGNLISHKTKGKSYFQAYSMDVVVEGKHVGRHGDTMALNSGSPFGGVHPAFLDIVAVLLESKPKCDEPYDRDELAHGGDPSAAQKEMVQGKGCWEKGCGRVETPMIADHQPPLVVTYHNGGCKNEKKMTDAVETTNANPKKGPAIVPHCSEHSEAQRRAMSEFSRAMNKKIL